MLFKNNSYSRSVDAGYSPKSYKLAGIQPHTSMRYPIPPEHLHQRQPQNPNIKPKRLAVKIFHIELHFVRYRQLIAAIHLRPAGQPGHQRMHTLLGTQFNQVVLIEQGRARPYKTHVAGQNAPQLRHSSKLLLRKKLPMGVKYASGLLNKCVATAGVPICMLRNLGILKILLLRPTRSDQYRAGPFEVRRTAKATSTIGNNKASPEQAPAIRSNVSAPLTPGSQGRGIGDISGRRRFQGRSASTSSTVFAAGNSRSTRRSQA